MRWYLLAKKIAGPSRGEVTAATPLDMIVGGFQTVRISKAIMPLINNTSSIQRHEEASEVA